MAIDGYALRERPWQPGLDDARFNQQPRNPNFTGGASPQADAYQRANGLRGMDAVERPWSGADTKTFGTRPAGVTPSVGERLQGAANTIRDGYARTTGNAAHFGPQPAAVPPPGGLRGALSTATKWGGRAAAPAGAAIEGANDIWPVVSDYLNNRGFTGLDIATQSRRAAPSWLPQAWALLLGLPPALSCPASARR